MRKLRDFILFVCLLLSNFVCAMEFDTRCQNSYEKSCGRYAIFGCCMCSACAVGGSVMQSEGMSVEDKRCAGFFMVGMGMCGLYALLDEDDRVPGCGDHSCVCGLIKSMIVSKHQKEE